MLNTNIIGLHATCDTYTVSSLTILKCPRCENNYSSERQARLLIDCGHTFCQQCIDDVEKTGDKPTKCPQCSMEVRGKHVPNITLMNYVEVQQHTDFTSRSINLALKKARCEYCLREDATFVCFQCLPTGFRFCNECCKLEHERPCSPAMLHRPKPIDLVPVRTFVPECPNHHGKPSQLFSFELKAFACEECERNPDFNSAVYQPIKDAVGKVNDQLQSLTKWMKARSEKVSQTMEDLDAVLGHLDRERSKATDLVRVEFNQFELTLRKRMNAVINNVEQEANARRKLLEEQMEQFEAARGAVDTSIVQASKFLQSRDYSNLHQAIHIVEKMTTLLLDNDTSIYRGAVTTGDIPVFMNPSFLEGIDKLGVVGGANVPGGFTCTNDKGLILLYWRQPDISGSVGSNIAMYEIEYAPADTTEDAGETFPKSVKVSGTETQKRIDGLIPGVMYSFRLRASNSAGWGCWGSPITKRFQDLPLDMGYTGEIVKLMIPCSGVYSITARGAQAEDGEVKRGGKGAMITAEFELEKGDVLHILCGGKSSKVGPSSGGGGGSFVAVNNRHNLLIAAGGGGGTRGHDGDDYDGKDASVEEDGSTGKGPHWAPGGVAGGPGGDANFTGPSWGHGGAGFNQSSTTAQSFVHGGEPGEGGGFGGGGAVGVYGGGGGGGYSGGGGGRGGGGGGSFVKDNGMNVEKATGHVGNGSVSIKCVQTSASP